MSAKFYTHFIAQSEDAIEYNEYRGVVELLDQSAKVQGDREIAACWHAVSISRKPIFKYCSGISCTNARSSSYPLAGFTSLKSASPPRSSPHGDPLAGFTSLH
jgi:hypothetical protein